MTTSNAIKGATGALALIALLVGSAELRAQDPDASSWLPWVGCWVEVGAPADAPMTCVVPEDGAAYLLTVTPDGETDRQLLRADGVERPVAAGGCEGIEAVEFSRDGARVFTRSRLSCEGGTERATRGMMAMVSPDEWIRVRALTVGAGSVSWVKRYRPAPESRLAAAGLESLEATFRDRGLALETARMAASVAPSADAIIEAHGRTDAEAVRAWLVEQGQPIHLDAETLIRMADAGVDESVIDVAVAVAYPERFAVARERDRRLDDRDLLDPYGYGWNRRGHSAYYDPFYYRYGYSPYGMGYGWGSYGYGSPTVIVVTPVGETDGSGRAVKGRGYTRAGASAGSNTVHRPATPNKARSGDGYRGSSGSAAASPSRSSSSSKGKAKPKGDG